MDRRPRPERLGLPQLAGIIATASGAALAVWCILNFAIIGRGTPAPFDPPRRLVVRGPYRYVLNPMYLGASLALVQPDLFNPAHLVGLLCIGLGAALLGACILEFARSGRGTLSPVDPPRELVVRGLYRYVRNPLYLSVTTIVLGELLLTGSRALLVYWIIWFAAVNLVVIGYEEPTLRRRLVRTVHATGRAVAPYVSFGAAGDDRAVTKDLSVASPLTCEAARRCLLRRCSMWKRLVATILALSVPAGVSAGPLKEAAEREARKLASAQRDDTRSRARVWTGIALIGGGAVLASLGGGELGGEDEGPNDPAEPSDGGEKGGKAMLAGGIAAAALGGVLLLTGRKPRGPVVSMRPGGVAVQHAVRF